MGTNLSNSKESKTEPNVVPLCDILLVLLIIFMVVTPLVKGGKHIALPEAGYVESQPHPGGMITVAIKKDGSIFLDLEPIHDLGKLSMMIEDKIAAVKPSETEMSKLLLKADEEIVYGKVTRVMEEIRKARVEIVGLLAQERVVKE
jgi:biopolymer transport protein TolR